jgi:hypothetical protein
MWAAIIEGLLGGVLGQMLRIDGKTRPFVQGLTLFVTVYGGLLVFVMIVANHRIHEVLALWWMFVIIAVLYWFAARREQNQAKKSD